MKKIAALFLALCVLCFSSAMAEEYDPIYSDGVPVTFEDFTLNLEKDTPYFVFDKEENQTYILVYPLISGQLTSNNYEIMYFDATKYDFDTFVEINKASLTDEGYTLQDYSIDPELYVCEMSGKQCAVRKITVSFLDPESDSSVQIAVTVFIPLGKPYLIVFFSDINAPTNALLYIVSQQVSWND